MTSTATPITLSEPEFTARDTGGVGGLGAPNNRLRQPAAGVTLTVRDRVVLPTGAAAAEPPGRQVKSFVARTRRVRACGYRKELTDDRPDR